MRTILAAALLALSTGVAFSSSLEDSAKAVYKLYRGDSATCSAVAVEPRKLVTAAHCVSPNLTIRIYDEGVAVDGKTWEVRSYVSYSVAVERQDKSRDVAVLRVLSDKAALDVVDVAAEYAPRFGDDLLALGYPRGDVLTLTGGAFTAIVPLTDLGLAGIFYKTTLPITGGSSGGALIRDFGNGDFRLVGLATATWSDVSFQSYFSTVDSLNGVLSDRQVASAVDGRTGVR